MNGKAKEFLAEIICAHCRRRSCELQGKDPKKYRCVWRRSDTFSAQQYFGCPLLNYTIENIAPKLWKWK